MRILHLVSYSLYSGPLPCTLGLALAQRKLGHDVWLAYDKKRGAFNNFEEAAAPRIEPFGLSPLFPLVLSAKSNLVELFLDYRSLHKNIEREKIDVVHAHLSHDHTLAALSMRRSAALFVRTIHSHRSLAARFAQKWLLGQATGFVLRSREHELLLMQLLRSSTHQYRRIPSGIDADLFVPPPDERRKRARREFSLPTDALVLGHVGLIENRGQFELLKAMEHLGEHAPFVLFVGSGADELRLKAAVEKSRIKNNVRFVGYLQGDRLLDGYAAMDAAFVARPGNDAAARAALEAMSCGLPVIMTRAGALGELVDAGVGVGIDGLSHEVIANAWLSLVDSAQRERRGQLSRDYIVRERSFTLEAQQTLDFYHSLRTARN